MSRFLESLKVHRGEIFNIEFHQERVNETAEEFMLKEIDLKRELKKVILPVDDNIYKLRFIYGKEPDYDIEIEEYNKPKIKKVKIVTDPKISYPFKYEDRTGLKRLYNKKGNADDILIKKDGLITDSYYCNVAFFDEQYGWITPEKPLLNGTKRRFYLSRNRIKEGEIDPEFINNFTKVSFFNSMIDLSEIEISVKNIIT